MASCVAERDNGDSRVRIELVEEWELLVADDSSGLLRTVLEAHRRNQNRNHSDFEH